MSDDKKHCGCFVVMKSGKRYLFEPGDSSYEWLVLPQQTDILRVTEKGKIAFEAPIENIECVGGERGSSKTHGGANNKEEL